MGQILSEGEKSVENFRERLETGIGGKAFLIENVLPELKQIFTPQPTTSIHLEPEAARIRLGLRNRYKIT